MDSQGLAKEKATLSNGLNTEPTLYEVLVASYLPGNTSVHDYRTNNEIQANRQFSSLRSSKSRDAAEDAGQRLREAQDALEVARRSWENAQRHAERCSLELQESIERLKSCLDWLMQPQLSQKLRGNEVETQEKRKLVMPRAQSKSRQHGIRKTKASRDDHSTKMELLYVRTDPTHFSSPLRMGSRGVERVGELPSDNPYIKALSLVGRKMISRKYKGWARGEDRREAFMRDLAEYKIEIQSKPLKGRMLNFHAVDHYSIFCEVLRLGGLKSTVEALGMSFVVKSLGMGTNSSLGSNLKTLYLADLFYYEQGLVFDIIPSMDDVETLRKNSYDIRYERATENINE